MKLFYSVNSPYSRKCRVVALEKGLKLESVKVAPLEDPPELHAVNPLGKVPALVTANAADLCDSTVICEYLDALSTEPRLIPTAGPERWHVLGTAALADGIMDLAVDCVLQSRRPPERQWPDWIGRREAGIRRTLDVIARRPVVKDTTLDLGVIALAVALCYLDFRLPHLGWRAQHPRLGAWCDRFSVRPSMAATMPEPA